MLAAKSMLALSSEEKMVEGRDEAVDALLSLSACVPEDHITTAQDFGHEEQESLKDEKETEKMGPSNCATQVRTAYSSLGSVRLN